jgi:hypothetical protein
MRHVLLSTLIAATALISGCTGEPLCDGFTYDSGVKFGSTALASNHSETQTTLIGWVEHRYDDDALGAHLRLGVLDADGGFTMSTEAHYVSSDSLDLSYDMDGGHLLNVEASGGWGWWIVDTTGALIDDDIRLPGGNAFVVEAAPGGFLYAVEEVNTGTSDGTFAVNLYRVGVERTPQLLGTVARSKQFSLSSARIGDTIWLAYNDAADQAAVVRVDLAGNVIDRLEPGGPFAAIASVGDRGMMFLADGTTVAIDASGLGARTSHPVLFEPRAYGVPGQGYLVGAYWLDLDGAIVGESAVSAYAVATVTPGGPFLVEATGPLGETRYEVHSTVEVSTLPFGSSTTPAPIVVAEGTATGRDTQIPCFQDPFPD